MNSRELLIDTHSHIPAAGALEALTAEDAERHVHGAPHSIAEIVAHLDFWQSWFCRRCEGVDEPVAQTAGVGWPAVGPGSWPRHRERFLSGLERMTAIGASGGERAISPPIQFPPLARYTVSDALVHVATHNAHHLGQIILLRQVIGRWPPPSGSFTW
jgi:uncharacterized damage-inducible protein DinB